MSSEDKQMVSYGEAIAMLPDEDYIHTFRQSGPMLIGWDWSRGSLLEAIEKHKDTLELTGPTATGMGHGLALHDDMGALFWCMMKFMDGL